MSAAERAVRVIAVSALVFATGLGASPPAAAETRYVIEQLVVNVNSAADGSGDRIATLKSGDAVELLAREGDQAQVRLASGSEGWMRASYLSGDPPLRERLAASTRELEQAKRDVESLRRELAAANAGARAPTSSAAAITAAAPASGTASEKSSAAEPTGDDADSLDAARDPAPLMPSEAAATAGPGWPIVLGASFLALILGFAIGWRTLDRRIREKYGGLRIY